MPIIKLEQLTYSPEQASQLLGVSKDLVYDELRNGKIPAIKSGRRWLISKEVFRDYINTAQNT